MNDQDECSFGFWRIWYGACDIGRWTSVSVSLSKSPMALNFVHKHSLFSSVCIYCLCMCVRESFVILDIIKLEYTRDAFWCISSNVLGIQRDKICHILRHCRVFKEKKKKKVNPLHSSGYHYHVDNFRLSDRRVRYVTSLKIRPQIQYNHAGRVNAIHERRETTPSDSTLGNIVKTFHSN